MWIDTLGLDDIGNDAVRVDGIGKLDGPGCGEERGKVTCPLGCRHHCVDSRALGVLAASLVIEHEECFVLAIIELGNKYRAVQLGSELVLTQGILGGTRLIETAVGV